MKGYGLTVFKGTEPERFDVEVIGVLHNFRPGQELILVKTPHPRLNVTKNVRGMSGSPIYLDGRLAGAYAYSWATFQVEPVAGVTPIAPMVAELRRPIPPGFWPLDGAGPLPKGGKPPAPAVSGHHASLTTFEGAPGTYDLTLHAKQLAERFSPDRARPIVPAATPLMLGGVGDRTASAIRSLFEPLGLEPMQAGGGGGEASRAAGVPAHFTNGAGLGVQMTRGDVSLMGLGTATYVEGPKVAGFGHPMMSGGDSALPACIGRVLWIFASDQHSSKIGECVRTLGAMVQDRQSAIVVDERVTAPTFPLNVQIIGADGAPKKVWHTDVAEEQFMSPSLASTVYGSVIEATVSEKRDVTWQLHSKISIRNHGTLELDDFGVAIGGTPDVSEMFHSRIVRALGDVLNNPWERTRIEKIESVMTVRFTRDLWRLRGAELLTPIVDAGGKARIRLSLSSYFGPDAERVVEVPISAELAGKDAEIEVIPGYEAAPEVAPPESLNELLANTVRQSYASKSVVLQVKMPGQGLAYRGHVATGLPSFAVDALKSATANTGPEAFVAYQRTVVPLDRYLDGRDKVKVKVRQSVR
jgi:hypothetical protein